MHAVHRPSFFLHKFQNGFAGGDGLFLVHVVTGTEFGMFLLESHAVYNVARYQQVARAIEGVTGSVAKGMVRGNRIVEYHVEFRFCGGLSATSGQHTYQCSQPEKGMFLHSV